MADFPDYEIIHSQWFEPNKSIKVYENLVFDDSFIPTRGSVSLAKCDEHNVLCNIYCRYDGSWPAQLYKYMKELQTANPTKIICFAVIGHNNVMCFFAQRANAEFICKNVFNTDFME